MMKKHLNSIVFLLLMSFLLSGCTEQYVIQTNTFEEALVVEATITNELKKQHIKISRTFRFEQNGPVFETGADVIVSDDLGNEYLFEEAVGEYVSIFDFQALPERTYRLNITTEDGRTYDSSPEKLSPVNEIESVVPVIQAPNNDRGVAIMVNSFDPTGASKYYRYEYEETYKVIAPEWDTSKAIVVPGQPGSSHAEIAVVPRSPGETKTCYKTETSSDILLTSTVGLNEDRVNFPVRFISNKNYIITHRYSILVRQYVQSLASYTFYKTLKDLSGSESILSQNQPGFFNGNLRSVTNPNEKVVGFFDVSSVSSKRIFFNYSDVFPGEATPDFVIDCELRRYGFCFISENPDCKGNLLLSAISTNDLLYESDFYDFDGGYQVYMMVPPPCGDCTRIASNLKPSFWIE